jgi:hypothetical protein
VIDGAVSSDTTVRWHPVAGAAGYRIVWRRTDTDRWTDSVDVGANVVSHVLKDIVIDDHFFGVAALGSGDAASLVSFGGLAAAP